MKNKCGISYKYLACVCMDMHVFVFPFRCKCRLASHQLHSFFKESENILKSFSVIYYKCLRIILIINLFHNFSIHLQNGVKKICRTA